MKTTSDHPRPLRALVVVLAFALTTSAQACSFAPGYALFLPGLPNADSAPPPAPILASLEITRGHDDGNFASCSDAGIFEMTFAAQDGVGFLFEPLGAFEDQVFPAEIVQLAEGRERFVFVWLDGSSRYQEAIDLDVRVTAFSSAGVASAPTTITIRHPGGRR